MSQTCPSSFKTGSAEMRCSTNRFNAWISGMFFEACNTTTNNSRIIVFVSLMKAERFG
jgi:hypothetical protein